MRENRNFRERERGKKTEEEKERKLSLLGFVNGDLDEEETEVRDLRKSGICLYFKKDS